MACDSLNTREFVHKVSTGYAQPSHRFSTVLSTASVCAWGRKRAAWWATGKLAGRGNPTVKKSMVVDCRGAMPESLDGTAGARNGDGLPRQRKAVDPTCTAPLRGGRTCSTGYAIVPARSQRLLSGGSIKPRFSRVGLPRKPLSMPH